MGKQYIMVLGGCTKSHYIVVARQYHTKLHDFRTGQNTGWDFQILFANCSVSAKSEVLNGWLPFMIESSNRIPFSDRIYGKYHIPVLFSTAARMWLWFRQSPI